MMKESLSKLEIFGIVAGSTALFCISISIFLLWYFTTTRQRLFRFFSSCCCSCSCWYWCSGIGRKKKQDSLDEYNFPPRRDNSNSNDPNLNAVSLGDLMINSNLIFPTVALANPVKHYTTNETSSSSSSFHPSRPSRFSRKFSTDHNNNTNGERKVTFRHAKNVDTSNSISNNNPANKNNNNCHPHHPFSLSRRGSKANSEEELNEELELQMTQSLYELEKIHKELEQTLQLDQESQDEKDKNNPVETGIIQSMLIVEKNKTTSNKSQNIDKTVQINNENKCASKSLTKEVCTNTTNITTKDDNPCKGKPIENVVSIVEEEEEQHGENKDMEIQILEEGKENRENITLNTLLKEKQINKYKDELHDNYVETIESFDDTNNINKPLDLVRSIIIAVDATPRHCGGYIIVPDQQLCESYSVNTKMLPWRLKNMTRRGNSSEFEMKNLFFALLNWEEYIREYQNIWLYTDNMGILENGLGNRDGLNVRAFIRHFKTCRSVTILNKNPYVHTYRNYKEFDKFIVPADHLSRRRFFKFNCHIQQHFPDITIFRTGFHKQKVEAKIENFIKQRCTTCHFRIRITGSLRDTIKRKISAKKGIIRNDAIPDFTTNNNNDENQQQ